MVLEQARILKVAGPEPVEWTGSDELFSAFDYERHAQERKESHTNPVPLHPVMPMNYLPDDGVTVVADHVRHKGNGRVYVDDATAYRIEDAALRGKIKDHVGYLRALAGREQVAPARVFEPTASMFTNLPKYVNATHNYRGQEGTQGILHPRLHGHSGRGWASYENPGKLPTISKLIYDGALPELTSQEAERRQWLEHSKLPRSYNCKLECDIEERGPPFRA